MGTPQKTPIDYLMSGYVVIFAVPNKLIKCILFALKRVRNAPTPFAERQ
jgi:hypothetical protein